MSQQRREVGEQREPVGQQYPPAALRRIEGIEVNKIRKKSLKSIHFIHEVIVTFDTISRPCSSGILTYVQTLYPGSQVPMALFSRAVSAEG